MGLTQRPSRSTSRRDLAVAGVVFVAALLLHFDSPPAAAAEAEGTPSPPRAKQNPLSRDSAAVQAGRILYLERCAVCHGQGAKGSMASNLVRSRSVARGADLALYRLIVQGIPGTEMPSQGDLEEDQVWQVVSYLHSLARPGLQAPVPGDAEAGRDVFLTVGCSGCHTVDGEGGFWGPSLDSIAARKTSEDIRRDVLEPNLAVREGYRVVSARAAEGGIVQGILKNSDTFSVQILRRDGTYSLLDRAAISEFTVSAGSAMPSDYGRTLTDRQLQDLLAFLDRQRDAFVVVERGFQNY